MYRKSSYDQIFPCRHRPTTGFTTISRNAGNLRNNGVEVSLYGRPIDTRKLSWDARFNWGEKLQPGPQPRAGCHVDFPVRVFVATDPDHGRTAIRRDLGYGWKKNCVAADPCFKDVPVGTKLIGDDGFPIKSDDQRNLGTVQPDWTGSLTSELRFGPLALSGLLDVRHGGRLINFETQYEVSNGRRC